MRKYLCKKIHIFFIFLSYLPVFDFFIHKKREIPRKKSLSNHSLLDYPIQRT